jgi:hypothetical protein
MGLLNIFKRKESKTQMQEMQEYVNSLEGGQKEMALAAMGLGMSKKETKNIISVINNSEVDRLAIDIKRWRHAISYAEDNDFPDRYELYSIYLDVVDDYQVASGMAQRTNAVALSNYVLKNDDGTINEDATKAFSNYYTYMFIKFAMLSRFYGYSCVSVSFEKGEIQGLKIVPFVNTAPEFKAVKKYAEGSVWGENLVSIDSEEYKDSTIEVFETREDLGILNKAVPYYIWKKVFGSWSQHADLFGMDTRIIKTDINDNNRRQGAINMLKSMVRASWGVFDTDDEFENVGSSKTDAYNIYEKLIDKCDSAISKIFLGQTGTTDEKSYAGSAKVHENIFESYVQSDKIFVKDLIQKSWVPMLESLNIIPVGLKFEWDDSTELDMLEKVSVIKDLAPFFNFSPEFINSYLGLQVADKTEMSAGEQVFENVAKLYMDGVNIPDNYKKKKEKNNVEEIEKEYLSDVDFVQNATEEEISDRFSDYKATVNMSFSELERWSETECSKKASLTRSPITRNLELLNTKKKDWTNKHFNWAGKTIAFVNRMKNGEQGEIVEGCNLSKRDISLKNWAFDPKK